MPNDSLDGKCSLSAREREDRRRELNDDAGMYFIIGMTVMVCVGVGYLIGDASKTAERNKQQAPQAQSTPCPTPTPSILKGYTLPDFYKR